MKLTSRSRWTLSTPLRILIATLVTWHDAATRTPSAANGFIMPRSLSLVTTTTTYSRKRRTFAVVQHDNNHPLIPSSSSSSSSSSLAPSLYATAAAPAGATSSSSSTAVREFQKEIESAIAAGKDPEEWLRRLEATTVDDTSSAPNRQSRFFGEWHVWYTNCPPPSNGKLGPFQGTARQYIEQPPPPPSSSFSRSYQNLLDVPPNNWLTAVLDGKWDEWDGRYLDDDGKDGDEEATATEQQRDWGANHWKVTFLKLQISLFGFPIFTKEFDAGTCRVWRTTYLDDEVRVVRAGKTGRLEDEVVFYTRRTEPPPGMLK